MKLKVLLRVCSRWGAVAGVLTAVLMVILFYAGRHPFLIAPYLDFRILLFGVFIFFALREFRDLHYGGVLYFWQGLIGSFVVVFMACALGGVGLYIFGKVEPEFVSRYVVEMTAYIKSIPPDRVEQIGKEVYERNLKLLPATNIGALVMTYFIQGMIIGFFISIVLSVILRRQPKI